MAYITESIPSQFIHHLAELKLKKNDPLKIWLDAINWSFVSQLCSHLYSDIGAPAYNPVSMFKALLLIYLGQADSERDLAEKLEFDVRLQLLCGFGFFDTPSHASFHNFRERLGSELFYDVLHQLIAQAIAAGVIKKTIHTAVDSTHLWANSNRFGIKVCQCSDKCKCLRKYSDPDAQWGHKTKTYSFFGYKVHLIVDTQSQLPIEVIVTSGEVPDNTQAADLIDGAMEHHPEITITSSAMDAAYDDTDVYGHCVEHDIHPIIPLNPRNQTNNTSPVNPKVNMDKDGCFSCSMTGLRLVKNGTEPKRKHRLKLICPTTGDRKQCPFRESCCPNSKVGKTFYLYPLSDVRLLGTIPRGSPQWKLLYSQRTSVERTNSLLKSPTHKLNEPRVRGMEQMNIHAFMSVCALIVKTVGKRRYMRKAA
jgi:transposase